MDPIAQGLEISWFSGMCKFLRQFQAVIELFQSRRKMTSVVCCFRRENSKKWFIFSVT
jgi:hypothetical protein